MKRMTLLMTMMTAGALTLTAQTSEVQQLRSDLIGCTMGGREKCWKFQSADQIKELVIKEKTEGAKKRVCTVALKLQAGSTTGKYAAEARVEYEKIGTEWKVKQVGLLSLARIE
jgi:hypothetical protein